MSEPLNTSLISLAQEEINRLEEYLIELGEFDETQHPVDIAIWLMNGYRNHIRILESNLRNL